MVRINASSVFKPVPEGWQEKLPAYQCDCGWTMPADAGENSEPEVG